jgi:hypothetical protein
VGLRWHGAGVDVGESPSANGLGGAGRAALFWDHVSAGRHGPPVFRTASLGGGGGVGGGVDNATQPYDTFKIPCARDFLGTNNLFHLFRQSYCSPTPSFFFLLLLIAVFSG